jgi:hypothetical protein
MEEKRTRGIIFTGRLPDSDGKERQGVVIVDNKQPY